jgi:hypothetical protein
VIHILVGVDRKNKAGKALAQPKDQTPLLPLSATRKVVRTPTNPFEAAGTVEQRMNELI